LVYYFFYMKKIITLFFYFIFLISAIFSLKLIPHIPVRYLPILELLPFVLMFISFILGIKFNRSQVIYSAIIFSLIYACFFWFIKPASSQYPLILNSITIFLSINIALISLYSERGVFTLIGLTRFIIIALQFVGVSWLIYIKHPEWHHFVNQIIFPVLQIKLLFFSQTALLSILISFFVVSISFFYHSNPFRGAILGGMCLALYAMTFSGDEIVIISVLFSFSQIFSLLTLVNVSYRMAYVDELTDLPGRRALNETLNKLGSKYVLAMLDVDHFKKFNDTYGHDAGDDVLRLLGIRLKLITGGGKPFRYGGEEFTLVFAGMSLSEVREHLEKLRENVANNKFTLRKQERRRKGKRSQKKRNQRDVKVTISIGYAERNDKAKTPNQVLKLSDKALYKAKRKGRNCISK